MSITIPAACLQELRNNDEGWRDLIERERARATRDAHIEGMRICRRAVLQLSGHPYPASKRAAYNEICMALKRAAGPPPKEHGIDAKIAWDKFDG